MGKVRTAKAKQEAATLGAKMRRRRLLVEVRQEAAEFAQGLRRDADPADAVQMILDHAVSAYEYATQQVMELPEDEYWLETLGGKVTNHWIREQERLGLQIVHIAGKASAMGLAERQIRIMEAQAAMFSAVVDAALVQLGLDSDQRREAHQLIAAKLESQFVDGTAHEIPENTAA